MHVHVLSIVMLLQLCTCTVYVDDVGSCSFPLLCNRDVDGKSACVGSGRVHVHVYDGSV